MSKKWALWAGAALGFGALVPSAAQAQQGGGPFADVPTTHWAYDAVQSLAQKGVFTGYPDGTFAGKRALTRYEFAVALQRMLAEVQRQIAAIQLMPGPRGPEGARGPMGVPGIQGPRGVAGPAGPPGVTPAELTEFRRQQTLLRQDITALQKLAQEFASELAMLGADLEQVKRNLAALADRVTRLEAAVARIPRITGAVNIGFRADSATADGFGPGFEDGRANAIPGLVDRDGRFLNPSGSLLERVNAFYDIDLGITANISDVATARLLLNAGNYLKGYLGNRISQVNPFIDGGVGGVTDGPNFTVEDVVPYYLYLEAPVKIGPVGTQLTVGKFGHQFTPYTLKMVDVDSYFYNDKTDLGDYPITGARANFRALGLNFSAYGGVHQNEYAQLSSTAGFLLPGVYLPDLARFYSAGGSLLGLLGAGSSMIEQSAGVRATYVGKRFQLGGTYLTGSAGTSDVPGVADAFRQLQVYGVDFRITPLKWLGISGNVTESRWGSQNSGNPQSALGISANDRRAWDLRVDFPIWKALITGYYKRIGDGFDAPGYWGRYGNFINPRGVELFGGTAEIPLGNRLVLDLEGAHGRFNLFRRAGVPGSDFTYGRAGLRFPLTARSSVDLGTEYVEYDADNPGGVDRIERYYNIGWSHQLSQNMSFRVLYQFISTGSNGILSAPDFDYHSNIVVTQFQARF